MADENIPVVIVTGANSGIGLAAALGFGRRGARVALVGRDQARLDSAVDMVRAAAAPGAEPVGYQADFADLAQVRKLATTLRDTYARIDVLANNAGAVIPRRVTTVDGYELTIQVNHLAPFLLTNLLREQLSGGRVITTASDAHQNGRLRADDLSSTGHRYRAFTVYGSSKQANIAFAAEAARRWPDIVSASFHPGVVRIRFGRDIPVVSTFFKFAFFLRTPEKGAETLLWLAQTVKVDSGGYYIDCRRRQASAATADAAMQAQLWAASASAVGLTA